MKPHGPIPPGFRADPDGMLLEFAGWSRELTSDDVNAEAMSVD